MQSSPVGKGGKTGYFGIVGVIKSGRQLYRVRLWFEGVDFWIGCYPTPEIAARVADTAYRLGTGGPPMAGYNFDGQPPPEVPESVIRQALVRKKILRR